MHGQPQVSDVLLDVLSGPEFPGTHDLVLVEQEHRHPGRAMSSSTCGG